MEQLWSRLGVGGRSRRTRTVEYQSAISSVIDRYAS